MSHPMVMPLIAPASLADLTASDWDRLLPVARQTGLLARVATDLEILDLLGAIPNAVTWHLTGALRLAAEHARMIDWELDRIERALIGLEISVILLKGAAYHRLAAPCARGRLVSDIDILVPHHLLAPVESALRAHAWEPVKLDTYDQSYYRRWMHELPPLRHRVRGTVIDVHHTILPKTSRLKPDPKLLFEAARPLPGCVFKVLSPTDMILHSAAHGFQAGELDQGLRDVLDVHDLCCHFDNEPNFWTELPLRAKALDLERPLYYGLRYAQRIFTTSVPPHTWAALERPPGLTLATMDTVVPKSLDHRPSSAKSFAEWLLYLRSHWLRMPPALLIRHLTIKGWRRWVERNQSKPVGAE